MMASYAEKSVMSSVVYSSNCIKNCRTNMVANLTTIFIVICFTANVCFGQLCGQNVKHEQLDVAKASKVMHRWYDAMDIVPARIPGIVFCYDVGNITEVDDGFLLTRTLQVKGRPAEESIDNYVHFIHNGDGTYTSNQELVPAMAKKARELFKPFLDEIGLQKEEARIYRMMSGNFFFLTDYDEYFIIAKCASGSTLLAAIKHKRKQPTGNDVVNIWNVFSKYGEAPSPHWEGFCTRRGLTKHEIGVN
uniref:uncharacterized protein LOC120325373 n=1 Tax=Styela clava TaxID=7725 RepID=UPI00193AD5B7|nr:uncharacterized protein LOC120325373 [Styela clava]